MGGYSLCPLSRIPVTPYVVFLGYCKNRVHKERVFTMNNLRKAVALTVAAASLSTCAIAASATGFEKGDFNMDGMVDSQDALLTLQASFAPESVTADQLDVGDMDDDGYVDAGDALEILRKSISVDGETIKVSDPSIQTISQPVQSTFTQVADMEGWDSKDVVAKVGPLFTEDQRKTGILASVSMAQFIVESGYGQSKLAIEANNCFGIKGYPEDQPRVGTPWDGVSVYTIKTAEYDSYGNKYYVNADFRKYACMEDSIADHSSVLLTSSDGEKLRYAAVVGVTDYRKACQIIKDGGYATAPDYVDLLCSVIEYWDLTQYDLQNCQPQVSSFTYNVSARSEVVSTDTSDDEDEKTEVKEDEEENKDDQHNVSEAPRVLYRVREEWDDASTQVGAYNYLENAKECADLHPGYNVYDEDGNVVYSS